MATTNRTPHRTRPPKGAPLNRPPRVRRSSPRRLVLVPPRARARAVRRIARQVVSRRIVPASAKRPRLELVVSNPNRAATPRTSARLLRVVRGRASEHESRPLARRLAERSGKSQILVVVSLLAAGLLTLAASLGQILAGAF